MLVLIFPRRTTRIMAIFHGLPRYIVIVVVAAASVRVSRLAR